MYKSPNGFKVDDGAEIDLDQSEEILAEDSKGDKKSASAVMEGLDSKILETTDSKSHAAELPDSSATNLEKLSEMSKQAKKTDGSLMDMIEFTKALTQRDEVPASDSAEGLALRPVKSFASCMCMCHPDDTGSEWSHDGDHECRCKAPSKAALHKSHKKPGLDKEDIVMITETTHLTGEEPIIIVANPPEPTNGPIALYPKHTCSPQCHCYLRHIQQGTPLEHHPVEDGTGHKKKCPDQCHCSCHKAPEPVKIECNHQCALHCEPEPVKEEASGEPNVDAIESAPIDSEPTKMRGSVIGSIAKLGSLMKSSMNKPGSASGAVPTDDDAAKSPGEVIGSIAKLGSLMKSSMNRPGSASGAVPTDDDAAKSSRESKRVSLDTPNTDDDAANPEEARKSGRSSGKGSIITRLSNSFRRSK